MFPILQAAQMRRDDRTDRAAVSRAVSVAADVPKNRADVQAGAAADAMERVALLGIGQEFGAMIVQQHDMPFLGTVAFAGLAGAGIHCVVTRQRLTGAHRGQHGQKKRKIFKFRQDFFDAEQGNHRFGQRRGEPESSVTAVFAVFTEEECDVWG